MADHFRRKMREKDGPDDGSLGGGDRDYFKCLSAFFRHMSAIQTMEDKSSANQFAPYAELSALRVSKLRAGSDRRIFSKFIKSAVGDKRLEEHHVFLTKAFNLLSKECRTAYQTRKTAEQREKKRLAAKRKRS